MLLLLHWQQQLCCCCCMLLLLGPVLGLLVGKAAGLLLLLQL
jgi:hypothetical protein